MEAFALCWANDPIPLLFDNHKAAEENRKWFTTNYKKDRHGRDRGAPFIVRLVAAEDHTIRTVEQPKPIAADDNLFLRCAAEWAFEEYVGTPREAAVRAAWESGRRHATHDDTPNE